MSSKHKSTRHDKENWLRKHPDLLDKPYYTIMKAMKEDELISESTYALDIKLPDLVRKIQAERESGNGSRHSR